MITFHTITATILLVLAILSTYKNDISSAFKCLVFANFSLVLMHLEEITQLLNK